MTVNVGESDRMIRFIAGAFLALIGAAKSTLLLFLAIVLLATAYLRTCPLYSLLNINTAKQS